MTVYSNTDYQVNSDYDLAIENRDLIIASAPNALSYFIIFRVLTTVEEWPNTPSGVVGLSRFFGQANSPETHRRIERDILRVLASKLDIDPEGIEIVASPSGTIATEAILLIKIKEIEYEDQDGEGQSDVTIALTFSYDFNSGKITFIDDIVG